MENNKENYNQLKEVINKLGLGPQLMYEDYDILSTIEESKVLTNDEKLLFEDLELEDSYGGEGDGESYWTVYNFPNAGNVKIRFNGYYASYNGAEYEDMDHVEPRQVEVTQYFII